MFHLHPLTRALQESHKHTHTHTEENASGRIVCPSETFVCWYLSGGPAACLPPNHSAKFSEVHDTLYNSTTPRKDLTTPSCSFYLPLKRTYSHILQCANKGFSYSFATGFIHIPWFSSGYTSHSITIKSSTFTTELNIISMNQNRCRSPLKSLVRLSIPS